MNINIYKLTCQTNLHMGSGDVNYNVIDLEVERDPVLGEPTMNASGIKGALRDACEEQFGKENKEISRVFGDPNTGEYKFFQGDLIARPVRVSEGDSAYTLATTPELVKNLCDKLNAFGIQWLKGKKDLPVLKEGSETVFSDKPYKEVEGIRTETTTCDLLNDLIGENWTLMRQNQLADIDLPVQAHNVLDDSGTSKNLWYEEVVPHKSIFYLMIAYPEGETCMIDTLLQKTPVIQFGAGATTGNGYIQMKCVWRETK